MSGFEAVGLALSIWPVVINVLDAYKLAVSGQGWELVCAEFKTERVIYVEWVEHLLQGSVTESELAQLCSFEKPNQFLWKEKLNDPRVRSSLERRLGPKKTPIVLETLKGMDEQVATLYKKIDTTESFLHKASHSKIHKFSRHIKINLPQSTIKETLSKVREHNYQLQRLINNSPTNYNSGPLDHPSKQNVLREITAQANDLHDAIYEGYNCQCRNPHEANLGTHPPDDFDLTQPFDLLFPVDEVVAKGITGQDLPSPKYSGEKSDEEYDFSSISDASRLWSSRGSIGTLPSPATSPGTPPPFRGRSVSFSQSHGLEDGGLINDLCQFIKKLGENPPVAAPASCLGVLSLKKKKYTVKVTSLDGDSTDLPSLVSLDEYLSPNHGSDVTRKKRMDLALSLSLAILQFYKTPWIDMWWTWKDFCVLKGDKSQIFVTKKFYSIHSPLNIKTRTSHPASTSVFWDVIGEPILTRLGFALVELALGQRLSEMRQNKQCGIGDEDMVDLLTARQLVEDGRVFHEAGNCYNEAVKACLEHQVLVGTAVTRLNSRDPKKSMNFQVDVERFVVAPIRDHIVKTWGSIQSGVEVLG